MTQKNYFSIFAVLLVLFGIGFVLAPDQVLINYGVESSPAIALMSRLFGGTLLAMAVILWSARDFHDRAAVRAVLIGSGISDVVNLVVALLAVTSGTVNALGWSTVLIYLCGALGAGYFLAASKAQQQAA
jgi:nitrate reductase gamma subunit